MKNTYKKIIAIITIISIIAGFSASSFPVFAETTPSLEAANVSGSVGDIVAIPVIMKNNPGFIGVMFTIQYDTQKLKLVEVTNGDVMASSLFTPSGSLDYTPFGVSWVDELSLVNHTNNGTMATFKFEILSSEEEILPIGIILLEDSTFNADFVNVYFETIGGSISVVEAACSHTDSEWEVATEATCEEDGLRELKCTLCGEVLDNEVIEATGHTFGAWVVINEPTEEEDGLERRTCGVCGEEEDRVISANAASFVISSKKAAIDKTIEVEISIENNPGIISARLPLHYDSSKLKLISITNASLLEDPFHGNDLSANPFILSWEAALREENITDDGLIVTLKFEVLEVGDAEIYLSIDPENDIFDKDFAPVVFTSEPYTIKMLRGDIDGSGKIDGKDSTTLRRYLAGWEGIEIDGINADVDGNGAVNSVDSIILRRYLAGWEGTGL